MLGKIAGDLGAQIVALRACYSSEFSPPTIA